MSSTHPPLDIRCQRLREVRTALLRLHKRLLDSEREGYEQSHGRIRSNGEFLRLVLEDEWFSWLRPFSQFIVKIDEALSPKESITLQKADELLKEASSLLTPSEEGSDREQRYYQAIQRDPDIAFMHAQISSLLATES
ncbi:hypothetical protein H6F61_28415 [Cyanobacteria bacterium FACHB-472]|nr:hypothetical protein [Cyanobacteria bacterium FACHB-472]